MSLLLTTQILLSLITKISITELFRSCHDELRRTTFYKLPYDIRSRQASP